MDEDMRIIILTKEMREDLPFIRDLYRQAGAGEIILKMQEDVINVPVQGSIMYEATARKNDEDKIRFDLMPVLPLVRTSEVLRNGAKKYTDRNWELGLEFHRPYRALLGHVFAWWNGEDNDPEWGLPHLAHAMCCLLMLMEYMERYDRFVNFDDRPYKETQ